MTQGKWKLIGITQYYQVGHKDGQPNQQIVALDRVSLTQEYGEIIGIIGAKGAGKTTLGTILLEELRPSEGLVSGGADKGARLCLPNRRSEERTGENYTRQQLAKWGITKKKMPQLVEQIHGFSELDEKFSLRLRQYSVEEKIRLEISILLHVAPTLIFIEDSLLTVKEDFYIKVFLFLEQLKELGSSIWIETENVKRIESYCDSLLWLEFGKVRKQGDVMDVLSDYYDYYFQVQCLSHKEQQGFWQKGYTSQLVENELESALESVAIEPTKLIEQPPVTLIRKKPLTSIASERKLVPFNELDQASEATIKTTASSALSRVQQNKRSGIGKNYWFAAVVGMLCLLVGAVFLAMYYPSLKAKRQPILPSTFQSSLNSTEMIKEKVTPEVSADSVSQSHEKVQEKDLKSIHVVVSGETLSQIADRFNVSISQLREWNQLTGDEIYPDLVLKLSAPKEEPSQGIAMASFTYQVKSGDSLTTIAEDYGVSLEALQKVNKLTDSTIYSGTVLSLPESAKAPAPSSSLEENPKPEPGANQTPKPMEHAVSQGETLYAIARSYGVDVMAIQQANSLQTEQLYLGQLLRIP